MVELLTVRRRWDDPRTAVVPLAAIESPWWTGATGGIGIRNPREYVHGFVRCDTSGDQGFPGHPQYNAGESCRLPVCVLRRENDPTLFEILVKLAGPEPR